MAEPGHTRAVRWPIRLRLPLLISALLLISLAAFAGIAYWDIQQAQFQAAGARLHVRLVLLFSVVAVTPAIVVAVFSTLFFNLGIQAWFAEPVRTALQQSQSAARGYADTTIADIVREASVSRRTFYENFADKAECLIALYEVASGNAITVLRNAIDPHSDWQAQVEQAMGAYFGVLERNPVLLRTQMAAGHGGISGRYERWKEVAFQYAWLLATADPGRFGPQAR